MKQHCQMCHKETEHKIGIALDQQIYNEFRECRYLDPPAELKEVLKCSECGRSHLIEA